MWCVTDKEIDLVAEAVLRYLTGTKPADDDRRESHSETYRKLIAKLAKIKSENDHKSLLKCVVDSKPFCRYEFLTSAALVYYGFPVKFS